MTSQSTREAEEGTDVKQGVKRGDRYPHVVVANASSVFSKFAIEVEDFNESSEVLVVESEISSKSGPLNQLEGPAR